MSRGSARVVAATVALVVLVGSTQLIDAAVAHTGVAAPWQVVGAMPEPNFAPGVVNGPDGLVYLFGGSTPAAAGSYSTNVWAYDPGTGTWTARAPMPIVVAHPTVSVAGGRILLAGYALTSEWVPIGVAYLYDTVTDTWATTTPPPEPISSASASTAPDGTVYVVNGYRNAAGFAVGSLFAYDPATRVWTRKASQLFARMNGATVFGPDGLLYLIGGTVTWNYGLADTHSYNPATDSWRELATMNAYRDSVTAVVGRDGRIYAWGGGKGDHGCPTQVSNLTETYSPVTNTWRYETNLPQAAASMGGARGKGGALLSFGGMTCAPTDNTLDSVSVLETPRHVTIAVSPAMSPLMNALAEKIPELAVIETGSAGLASPFPDCVLQAPATNADAAAATSGQAYTATSGDPQQPSSEFDCSIGALSPG